MCNLIIISCTIGPKQYVKYALIRESQTADMYRFLGHYDRPYTPGSSQACVLPKENAYFGPEELQFTLKGRPTRVKCS